MQKYVWVLSLPLYDIWNLYTSFNELEIKKSFKMHSKTENTLPEIVENKPLKNILLSPCALLELSPRLESTICGSETL